VTTGVHAVTEQDTGDEGGERGRQGEERGGMYSPICSMNQCSLMRKGMCVMALVGGRKSGPMSSMESFHDFIIRKHSK
jgi:hypothetical protein